MRMPTLVPSVEDRLIYFVLCDYGPKIGRSYYEADPETSDRETVLQSIAEGQYTNPIEVLEVNKAAGTCRDVTRQFMAEVEERTAAFQ
jgi:hypothetical protein